MNQRQANIAFIEAYRSFLVLIHHSHTHKKTHRTDKTEENRTEQNRTEQNRTEQNKTRTEQNKTNQTKLDWKPVLCQRTFSPIFMFAPYINSIKTLSIVPTVAQYYKSHINYKQFKIIKLATTCFGSRRNHRQGAVLCLVKTTARNTTGSNHCIILLSS